MGKDDDCNPTWCNGKEGWAHSRCLANARKACTERAVAKAARDEDLDDNEMKMYARANQQDATDALRAKMRADRAAKQKAKEVAAKPADNSVPIHGAP